MDEEQKLIDQKFGQIVNNPVAKTKQEPAKFPELRYLWGITLIGSFALVILAAVISTIIEAV
jgi:hypothetical protein